MTNHPPRPGALPTVLMLAVLAGITSCGHRSYQVEVIDLDRVLTIFSDLLKEPIGGEQTAQPGGTAGEPLPELSEADENPVMTSRFVERFADKLNEADLMKLPIGVLMNQNGALLGFTDRNGDRQKNGGDRDLFKIEIDPDNGRVLATDMQRSQYRREHRYHGYHHGYGYHGGGGFWLGYMLGSMRGRSNRYYAAPGRQRPNFSGMSLAPQGYHATATKVARTRARTRSRSSARTRGGSRSFRLGK